MFGLPMLSTITWLPTIGAVLILIIAGLNKDAQKGASIARILALITTLITFVISVKLVMDFDHSSAAYQFKESIPWYGTINYAMSVDGISILFVLLTTFLLPLCVIASWKSVEKRVVEYFVAFLVLESLMIGVFCASDLVLFYILFEAGLIPMYLIIGIWGGKNRFYAAYKFFLYTLLGSLFMLIAVAYMAITAGTTDIETLQAFKFGKDAQIWLWIAFFASFAVKMPMWPVHTWLPDAHVEAPTAGSVILAGVLLKMGGYGFLRFSLPMFPLASIHFQPLVFTLSVIAVIYTSLVAFRQLDIKKLIAYSSVAHMGFVTLGIFAFNAAGIQGAIFQMLSHGIISGALFLCVGVIYDRMHTREIAAYGGLVNRMPIYAAVFMLFTMGNVGLPGTSGFVGEVLTMQGVFLADRIYAIFAATGVILSAAYMLTLYRKTVFGPITNPELETIQDMNWREVVIFLPLIIGAVVLGFKPQLILGYTDASVMHLVDTLKISMK
jgi:NADH-quinone oxidoreductase subunit M